MKLAPIDRWTRFSTARIGGLAIVTASRAELADALIADHRFHAIQPARTGTRLVFDANGQALSLAARDPAYRRALAQADIVHADGGFLITLSRWIGSRRIAERSATTDLIHDLAARCAREGLSFYLLGGSEDVNARCAARLVARYPGLRIAGRHHGYFAADELDRIVEDIAGSGTDVLWLGLGKPREQILATTIAHRTGATWLVTCGGCFDFVAGNSPRAPRWMQSANLEWLYRLAQDPRRLFWRYATTNPHAVWVVGRDWLRSAVTARRSPPSAGR